MKKKTKQEKPDQLEDEKFPLPIYSADEDIYRKEKETSYRDGDEDPKELRLNKNPASGLDIPGSDLDDKDEDIGEEDEENNYYSLGGDDHDDLEEDKGE